MDQGRQRRDQVTRLSCWSSPPARRGSSVTRALPTWQFPAHLATPEPIKDWPLMSLKEKLIKIGVKTPAIHVNSRVHPANSS
jgi:hypothetical protein